MKGEFFLFAFHAEANDEVFLQAAEGITAPLMDAPLQRRVAYLDGGWSGRVMVMPVRGVR